MNAPFVRSAYNYDVAAASDESGLECTDPSLAKQEFADEVDINTIVNRFLKTGQVPDSVRIPTYGDFDGVSDFHTAMNVVRASVENFMLIPAQIRSRFENDPQKFLEFCSDDKNREALREMGLLKEGATPSGPKPGEGVPGGASAAPVAAPAAPATVPS